MTLIQSIKRRIVESAPKLAVAEIFPPLEAEIGDYRSLLRGRVLNAGAGNRDLSSLVDGELTNQDIPQGRHNANIHIHSPLHEIPRQDGYFDVVFCNAVLEHVANPEEVMREFARVCRPGGVLYLAVPFMQPEHKDPTDFQRYTADGLSALVRRHGFEVESVEPVHSIYATFAWLVVVWLSQRDSLRNALLKWIFYPLLRLLCRRSNEQVFAAASTYRLIARRAAPLAPGEKGRDVDSLQFPVDAPCPDIQNFIFGAIREIAPNCGVPLTLDTPLGTAGVGLDSIGFLELVLAVERRSGVRLRDANLTAGTLATPDSLIRHIEKCRCAADD